MHYNDLDKHPVNGSLSSSSNQQWTVQQHDYSVSGLPKNNWQLVPKVGVSEFLSNS